MVELYLVGSFIVYEQRHFYVKFLSLNHLNVRRMKIFVEGCIFIPPCNALYGHPTWQ